MSYDSSISSCPTEMIRTRNCPSGEGIYLRSCPVDMAELHINRNQKESIRFILHSIVIASIPTIRADNPRNLQLPSTPNPTPDVRFHDVSVRHSLGLTSTARSHRRGPEAYR